MRDLFGYNNEGFVRFHCNGMIAKKKQTMVLCLNILTERIQKMIAECLNAKNATQ